MAWRFLRRKVMESLPTLPRPTGRAAPRAPRSQPNSLYCHKTSNQLVKTGDRSGSAEVTMVMHEADSISALPLWERTMLEHGDLEIISMPVFPRVLVVLLIKTLRCEVETPLYPPIQITCQTSWFPYLRYCRTVGGMTKSLLIRPNVVIFYKSLDGSGPVSARYKPLPLPPFRGPSRIMEQTLQGFVPRPPSYPCRASVSPPCSGDSIVQVVNRDSPEFREISAFH